MSLEEAMDRLQLEARAVNSLAGKIINVKAKAVALEKEEVEAPAGCGRQLQFWHVMLRTCSGVVSMPGVQAVAVGGVLAAGVEQLRNMRLVIWVDYAGSVAILAEGIQQQVQAVLDAGGGHSGGVGGGGV